jgi:hypothetical protein
MSYDADAVAENRLVVVVVWIPQKMMCINGKDLFGSGPQSHHTNYALHIKGSAIIYSSLHHQKPIFGHMFLTDI